MYTKQVSIFLENKKGRLAEVTGVLAAEGVNIRALSLAETADFGVLRLIVDDPERCLRVLKAHDLAAQQTDMLAVEIDDEPGSLHRVVEAVGREGVSIEYMYAFFRKKGDNVIVVFRSDDAAQAAEALRKGGIPILPEAVIQNL